MSVFLTHLGRRNEGPMSSIHSRHTGIIEHVSQSGSTSFPQVPSERHAASSHRTIAKWKACTRVLADRLLHQIGLTPPHDLPASFRRPSRVTTSDCSLVQQKRYAYCKHTTSRTRPGRRAAFRRCKSPQGGPRHCLVAVS